MGSGGKAWRAMVDDEGEGDGRPHAKKGENESRENNRHHRTTVAEGTDGGTYGQNKLRKNVTESNLYSHGVLFCR